MEIAVALTDYALALSALLGTLLIPFAVSYQMLRLKRRAVRVPLHSTPSPGPRGIRR